MAAELHGIGLLVLAVAVLLLPAILRGRPAGRLLTLAAVVVSAGVAVTALPVLLSSLEGEAVSLPRPWVPGILLCVLGVPALLATSAALATPAPPRAWRARWTVILCVILVNNPGFLYSVAPLVFLYSSHDANPWVEAIGGVLLIGASILVWLTHQHDDAPDTDTPDGATPATMTSAT
jgi:hypothetical protein